MKTPQMILSVEVAQEHDVVLARQRAKQIAGLLGFGVQDQTRIATTVSELARNAVVYASGGRVEFVLESGDTAQLLIVHVRDSGPGIEKLQEVLAGTYSSETGMGLGISGARRLMDHFHIESGEEGTLVTVGMERPATARPVDARRLASIGEELSSVVARTPLDEVHQQNQELLRALDALEHSRQQLVRLNTELVDTNRGIVALYAELDEKAQELHRANRVKSRFLAHMSHEFRTPLNSILALARLLLDEVDGELGEEQSRQVTYIRRAANDLLELVNDLLDLTRVEAGSMDVHLAPCRIEDVFSTLRGMFHPIQVNSPIVLEFVDATGLPMLNTDEAKVMQILRNFISNALKFTEKGSVRVSAELLGDGGRMRLAVADTGIGIAEADRPLIFQEFTQVSNRLQGSSVGSGLGLAISRRLAELLGGSVAVEGNADGGSTFHLEIPVEPATGEVDRRESVLIIDDSDVDRYLLRGLLDGAPFEIVETGSATEGLRMALSERPRAVFLDLSMPEMDGLDLLRKLRASSSTSDIPVAVVTSQELNPIEADLLAELKAVLLSKRSYSQRNAASVAKGVLWELTNARGADTDSGPDER